MSYWFDKAIIDKKKCIELADQHQYDSINGKIYMVAGIYCEAQKLPIEFDNKEKIAMELIIHYIHFAQSLELDQ